MEMQDISEPEGEKKECEEETAQTPPPKPEVLEEEKPSPYSELQGPTENIYSEAHAPHSAAKVTEGKKSEGNPRLYRVACLLLTILCLILLLVVILLSLKLQTGSTECPETQKGTGPSSSQPSCSSECCQTLYPATKLKYPSCRQCPEGWLSFDKSCFYLSVFRLSWDESQRNCSATGGSLAVVNSPEIQTFLTEKGRMSYWIGLRQSGSTWTWVDSTRLEESFWNDGPKEEHKDCVILNSRKQSGKNWHKGSCRSSSYYICQQ